MQRRATLGRLVIIVGVLASMVVVRVLRISNPAFAVGFGIWLLLPYAGLATLLRAQESRAIEIANVATVTLVTGGGLCFLALVLMHPDAQGGVAVVLTPIYQAIATIILIPLTRWHFNRHNSASTRAS